MLKDKENEKEVNLYIDEDDIKQAYKEMEDILEMMRGTGEI